MKARIVSHKNPVYVGMVCDVVYYDFDEEESKIVLKSYSQGEPLELYTDSVRIIFENLTEREQLERYVFEKAFTHLWY